MVHVAGLLTDHLLNCVSLRELSNISLFQSLSRPNTVTASKTESKHTIIDRDELLQRLASLVRQNLHASRGIV